MISSLLLIFLLLLLLLLFLLSSLPVSASVPLVVTSGSVPFLQLPPLYLLLPVQLFNFLLCHPQVAPPSSESSRSPVEDSPSPLIVHSDLRSINFAVVSTLVCSSKILLGVELDKPIPFGFPFQITNYFNRLNNAVFLQLNKHLPRISN